MTVKFIILCLLGITIGSIILTTIGAIALYFLSEAIFNSLQKRCSRFSEDYIDENSNILKFLGIKLKRNPNKIRKVKTKDRGEVWYIDLQ